MDAAIASEANIDWLGEQGYPYIVVSRQRHLEFNEDKAVAVKESEDNSAHAMRVEHEDGEIDLYCHSGRRKAKECAINERSASLFYRNWITWQKAWANPVDLKMRKRCVKR